MADTVYVSNVTPITADSMNDLNRLLYTILGDPADAAAARAGLAAVGLLTTVAGTNTITATSSPVQAAYVSGQSFVLIPAVTNTAATTLNIAGLGAKNVFVNGAACAGGELVAGVPYIVEYDGSRFNAIGWTFSTLTNSLGSDVALNDTGVFFDGPSVAQGNVGKWIASGNVTILDVNSAATFNIKLWDGTTIIASTQINSNGANAAAGCHLSGYLQTPAGNIRISVQDISSTNGNIKFNQGKSTVSVIRIG